MLRRRIPPARIMTLWLASLLGSGLSLASPTEANVTRIFVKVAPFPKVLRLHSIRDYQTFEYDVIHNTTSRLIRFRGDRPAPELADSWRVSPDMLSYTFHLRKDRRYSDGSPILADDVIYSIKRSLFRDGQFAAIYRGVVLGPSHLKNLHAEIPGVRKVDEDTIEFRLSHAVPSFMADLAMLTFSVFSPSDVDPDDDFVHENFRSSGAYTLKSMSQEKVILTLNRFHWKARDPHVPEEIVILPTDKRSALERLRQGEIDFANADMAFLTAPETTGKKDLQAVPIGPYLAFLTVDFKGPLLSKVPEAAGAINRLIDRKRIAEDLERDLGYHYKPTYFVTANIGAIEKEAETALARVNRQSEVQRLKRLIAKSSSASPLVIAYDAASDYRKQIAGGVAEQLRGLGLQVKVIALPFTEITRSQRSGVFDLATTGHGIDGKTPADALQYLVGSQPSRSNLPSTHPIFAFYKKITQARSYDDHLRLLREYNGLIEDSGAIMPLLASSYASVFSAKIDVSKIDPFEDHWPVYELGIKDKGGSGGARD